MGNDHIFTVRKYDPEDRGAVRRICCQTALMGEPSTAFFNDDEILADALTAYFTDHEPESCIVAEYGGKVIGYLLGAIDEKRMERAFALRLALPITVRALLRGVFFSSKNLKFLSGALKSLMNGEFSAPAFDKDYPAVLHINIDREYRAKGLGAKLINAYLAHLKARAVKGVHFATMSDAAGLFFAKLGFQILFKGHRSYFRRVLGNDVPVYIYGMRL